MEIPIQVEGKLMGKVNVRSRSNKNTRRAVFKFLNEAKIVIVGDKFVNVLLRETSKV